jgi:electron transfer flavoprotein alpha subunit
MADEIFVLVEHVQGKITDGTYEVLTLGRELATKLGRPLKAVVLGKGVDSFVPELGFVDGVVTMDHELLENISVGTWASALAKIIEEKSPEILLMGSTNPLMGLPSYLSEKIGIPFVNLCKSVSFDNDQPVGNVLLYGGKIEGDIRPKTKPVVVAVRPGNYPGDPAKVQGSPAVEAVSPPETLPETKMRFKGYIQPEVEDVDLTQCDVIVSVGRGIENEDNVSYAEDLAKLFKNAAVAGSRPVVDQGWLPMTRQVGKSGVTVKPKLYLALGISGAPEHVEGMKSADLIIAINTDPKAPIFSVAHFGIEGDIFDIIDPLVEKLEE